MAEHTPLWHGVAVARAVHAIKWQLQHRDMQLEAMADLTPPAADAEPLQLPPQAA